MAAHWSPSCACSLLVAENEVGKMQPVNSRPVKFFYPLRMTGKTA